MWIALVIAAVVAALAVLVATRPAAFRIARSTTIAASADTVFALLDDFRAWSQWSPWEKLDPDVKKVYEGPPAGVGTVYHYVGKKTGEGRMTITASTPREHVGIRAQFIKPFAATNQVDFTLEPTAGGVAVTWSMTGHNGFFFKAFGLLVNVDRMIGKEFEQGLADLARVAEARRSAPTAAAATATA